MKRWIAVLMLSLGAVYAYGANPIPLLTTVSVDLVEINHYYDENGAHLLDQLIFYDWDEKEDRYNVRAWRLAKNSSQVPRHTKNGYETKWTEGGVIRIVVAPKARETWTQYDIELIERKFLSREERIPLFNDK